MFVPILQSPSSATVLVVHSDSDPTQLAATIRNTLHQLDAGLPVYIETPRKAMGIPLFAPHGRSKARSGWENERLIGTTKEAAEKLIMQSLCRRLKPTRTRKQTT